MMGSGKSKTGPLLAKEIGYRFVDADKVLEELVGKSINQVFDEDGEVYFRDIESQILSDIGKMHSLVVATGGGVVIRSKNWGYLHQGIVIWLNVNKEKLIQRLSTEKSSRPLLNQEDFISVFNSMYENRLPKYMSADLSITVQDESPESVVINILNNLPSILRNPEDLI